MKRRTVTLAVMLTFVVASLAASPAAAQESVGEDQYAGDETGSISGVITENSGGSVTVEGTSSADACGAAILELSEGTEILLQQGEETVPATVEDLRVGEIVEATYAVPDGPQIQVCPQTYEALQIVIAGSESPEPPPENPPGNGDDQYPDPGNGDGQYPAPGDGGARGGLPPDSSGGDVPADTGSGGNASGGAVSVLPDTGGVALGTLGAGAMLVGLGLLARRLTR